VHTLLPALAPVVALTLFIGYFVVRDRLMMGGFGVWERRRLSREGRRAEAVVLSRLDRGASKVDSKLFRYELVLEVRPAGAAPYRVPFTFLGTRFDATGARGDTLPVLVDPADPKRVMVDLDAVWAARDARRASARDAEAERQRARLDERP
jgi:hypothetical protein